MKYKTQSLIIGFLLLLSQHTFSQNKYLTAYKTYFDTDLNSWTRAYKNFKLSTFKISDTFSFENIPFDEVKNLKEFYELYKPALTFTADSNKFIDIYSYQLNLVREGNKIVANIEIDQAISLCDLKTKKWNRIFFGGMSSIIEEVTWISNTKFILTGYEMDEYNEHRPKIYIGDIGKQKLFVYSTNDNTCVEMYPGYNSEKQNKLRYEE